VRFPGNEFIRILLRCNFHYERFTVTYLQARVTRTIMDESGSSMPSMNNLVATQKRLERLAKKTWATASQLWKSRETSSLLQRRGSEYRETNSELTWRISCEVTRDRKKSDRKLNRSEGRCRAAARCPPTDMRLFADINTRDAAHRKLSAWLN